MDQPTTKTEVEVALTIGEQLKNAREKQNLTREWVADQLKVSLSYIHFMENNEFSNLPGYTFTRGYIQHYAELLRLDAIALVEQLKQESGQPSDPSENSIFEAQMETLSTPHRWLMIWVTVLVILVIAGGSWWYYERQQSNHPVVEIQNKPLSSSIPKSLSKVLTLAEPIANQAEPSGPQVEKNLSQQALAETLGAEEGLNQGPTTPVNELESPQTQAKAVQSQQQNDLLVIDVSANCWVEIKNQKGDIVYSDVLQGGTGLTLQVPKPFSVRLGNTPAVSRVSYQGETIKIPKSRNMVNTLEVGN